jgi:hypothetical protein
MNVNELMEWDGLSREQAEREIAGRVFGVGHQLDKHGTPIEQGIGSAAQQSAQHKAAVEKERQRQAQRDK